MMGLPDNHSRSQKGYTLIELLLVLTVLALIAALAVKTYRDKALSDRINIAALNIQHVLEAGMSYNVAKNGFWPKKNWNPCNSGSTVSDQTFLTDYLPNESNQSNFGNALCWSGDDPNDPTLEQQGKRFWVALKVGSDSDSANIAQRIAARLPNAIITNTPDTESSSTPTNSCTEGQDCYVKAVVSVPSASTNNSLTISALGYCNSNLPNPVIQPGTGVGASCMRTALADQFPGAAPGGSSLGQYQIVFQCKPGETPKLYVTPDFLRVARSSTTGNATTIGAVDPEYEISGSSETNSTDSEFAPTSCTSDNNGVATCIVTMHATYDAQSGQQPADVGCAPPIWPAHCHCPLMDDGHGNKKEVCPDKPGAIGASYVAACAPASPTTKLSQVNW
ncbi:MAG: prepilin-type N-terminal cleavage/methylation domain-containing protein [Proteobacteria bacterium]|nr:prepilin-type N-terminal cleavage/methylation domain-containing protein [Pseudomonadota bacterium]